MNFYPTYDETYHEHNEPPFHPIPEHHECECGAELTRENPPVPCDCGAMACSECIHTCELCGHEGCDACQTDTGDGWLCNDHASEPQSTEARLMNNALDAVYAAIRGDAPTPARGGLTP